IRLNSVEVLEEMGYRVDEAGTAVEAMRKLRAAKGDIAAAIIDLGLPDSRGDALAAELRAFNNALPIVIASGYADREVHQRFATDPLVSFLNKPYDGAQLRAALRTAGVREPAKGAAPR